MKKSITFVLALILITFSSQTCAWHDETHLAIAKAASYEELDRRLISAGHRFEWAEIKQDLKALQRVTIAERGCDATDNTRRLNHA